MCFSVGIIQAPKQAIKRDQLAALHEGAQAMAHRARDGNGFYQTENIAIINGRLAFQDTSAQAALPRQNQDASVCLAFSGEITNFQELRERHLAKQPIPSRADSDVFLQMYEQEGIACLQRFTGMFAGCIVDNRKQRAYLFRDFYGITPLFYASDSHQQSSKPTILFSSEIKGLLAFPQVSRQLNRQAIYDLFTLAYIPGAQTPFQDIHELEAARYLEIDLHTMQSSLHEYYCLPAKTRSKKGCSPKQIIRNSRELLFQSVQRNLISDAPLGIALSGGVDSTGILAIASRLTSKPLSTFSLRIEGQGFDESKYQKIAVDAFSTTHQEVTVTLHEVEALLEKHLAYIDEPYGHGAAIPTYALAQTASEQVKGLLSGEGGDEVFAAYDTYSAWKVRRLYRQSTPAWMRTFLRKKAEQLPVQLGRLSLDFKTKRFLAGSELPPVESHLYWRHVLPDSLKQRLFLGEEYQKTSTRFSDYFTALDEVDELNRLSYVDIKNFFVGDLMVKNDRMVFAHSLEGRYPYMDRELVDYVLQLPADLRFKGFSRRWLQKQILQDLIPAPILKRKKVGLEMPYAQWLLNPNSSMAKRYFTRDNIGFSGLFQVEVFFELYEQHKRGQHDWGRFLWTMLLFLVWQKQYVQTDTHKQWRNEASARKPTSTFI